jgi:KUP system potassium uptake protein
MMQQMETRPPLPPCRTQMAKLTLVAIGVVFGDIGTSPLYTMKEVFGGHGIAISEANVLGILSLVFWALTMIVSLKYVMFIMRADNRGEGGIMALTALAQRAKANGSPRVMWALTALGIFGAALFYGDGVITPAMSVLSAIEGVNIATPGMERFVVPITIIVLIGLFWLQRKGTANVGTLFGPVMTLWFFIIGVLGLIEIIGHPRVLLAINPWFGLNFFVEHRLHGFLALGSVVLAVTGGEALYADMGHFGRNPIKLAWFCLVFPCLYINYLGQGALLLSDPTAVRNPFYLLAPQWALYPMVALATFATIIASQAVISGAFSLTRQATQLGYCPRMAYVHTSYNQIGQVYIPGINGFLLISVISLVLGFRSSSNLASAYGIAVTITMLIDTILAFVVVQHIWNWSWLRSVPFLLCFLVVDLAFVIACSVKITDGGWFPLTLGGLIFTLLATWHRGRTLLTERTRLETMPLDIFVKSLLHAPPIRVEGTGVFMTSTPDGVPRPLLHNLLHNKVLHERVVLLTVRIEDVPNVHKIDRIDMDKMDFGFYRMLVRYGFKDEPDIPEALQMATDEGLLSFHMMETTFFLGREHLVACSKPGMVMWRERLFFFLHRNAGSMANYFKIPPNRVVEFGTQVEI